MTSKSRSIIGLLAGLACAAAQAFAAGAPDPVLDTVRARYGGEHTIVARLELTKPFATRSPWALVVAKQTDKVSEWEDANPLTYCLVHAGNADCDPQRVVPLPDGWKDVMKVPDDRALFEHRQARIVHMPAPGAEPLLLIQACTQPSGDGDCGIYTFLYSYDRTADQFKLAFRSDGAERNRNGATRFIQYGPLAGYVASVNATDDAPYAYWITVYERGAGGSYHQVLKYRSVTRYGDGDRRSVVDSDMPEMIRRMAAH